MKKTRNKTVPITLAQEAYNLLKQIAARTGIPIETLIAECLTYGLKNFAERLPSLPSKAQPALGGIIPPGFGQTLTRGKEGPVD